MQQNLLFTTGLLRYSYAFLGLLISTTVYGQALPSADSTIASTAFITFSDSTSVLSDPFVLHTESFNKGLITSLEQAITAQFAGLRITPHSGKPGTPYTMEAGHGNSFVGNNSPLLVIDGVLLNYADVSPNTGFLSFLNPEDVASVVFLRDAAAMAVYGGKAVNGVLFINTKSGKPGSKTRVQFNSTGAVSSLRKKADILTGDEMRNLLQMKYPNYTHLAGTHNTDWQDAIYQNGYSLDNNLSLGGAIKSMPYRLSAGHLTQQGILKTSGRDRKSLALNLNPSLFQEHLTLDVSLLHSRQQQRVANESAIYYALDFDPTQPVYAPNEYGGYFVYYTDDRNVNIHQPNPLSMLEQRHANDDISTWLGQAHVRYKLHFLPSVSLNYRHAYQSSNSFYQITADKNAAFTNNYIKLETNENRSKREYTEAFIDYNQNLTGWQGRIKVAGGALKTKRNVYSEHLNYLTEDRQKVNGRGEKRWEDDLEFYGKLQVDWRDKYSTMLSVRHETSSPSLISRDPFSAQSIGVNFGWDIKKTALLNELPWLSQMHARLSGGLFERLDNPNQYLLLYANQFGIAPDLTPEKTFAKRLDLNYGLWQNRLQGSLAYYHNQSSDMMLAFMVPPTLGHPGYHGRNAGELRTTGLETTFMYKAVDKGAFYLNLGLNASLMDSEVLSLEKNRTHFFYDESHNNYLISEVGQPIQSFGLFKQLYGLDGKPLTGYETNNNLPVRSMLGAAKPSLISGFQTNAGYGKWHASMLVRGSFGNNVYNTIDAHGSWFGVGQNSSYLRNASRVYEKTGFYYPFTQSDYFLEPGSFVRLDYLQLQYDFGNVAGNKANLKLHATAQNAFVLTKYSGQDPETRSGMDVSRTPQPSTFSVGLQLGI